MRKFDLLTILLLLLALALLSYSLDKPFWGQFDWTGAWFGTIARNYLEIPLAKSRLAPITVAGTANRADWQYYNHYSVAYPFLIAGSLLVFGDHEWSIRLVSLVFSLLMLGAFYVLCRRFFHPLVGIFGIIVIIFSPMFVYYGKLPVHEQPVLFLSLVSLFYYLSWTHSAKRADFIKMFLSVILGFLISWTGGYILILMTLHLFYNQKFKAFLLTPFYLVLLLILALHLIHIYISSDMADFVQALAERTSGGVNTGKILFTPLSFLARQTRWFFVLYTRPVALIVLLNFFSVLVVDIRRRALSSGGQLLIVFFAWGFFQWLVVPRITWIHDYMLIYFLPFVGLSSGLLMKRIWDKNRSVGLVFCLFILVISVVTSLPFTAALLRSKDQTSRMYAVAKFLRKHTIYGDRILMAIKPGSEFEIHYPSHYLSYYSNRFVKYQFTNVHNKREEYKYIIVPQGEADPELARLLREKYNETRINNFSLYEIR